MDCELGMSTWDISIKSYVYPKNTEFSETLVRWPLFLPLPILHDFVRFYEGTWLWKPDILLNEKGHSPEAPQKTHEIQIVVEFSRWTIKELLRGARASSFPLLWYCAGFFEQSWKASAPSACDVWIYWHPLYHATTRSLLFSSWWGRQWCEL